MDIVVSGSSGFIGTALCAALVEDGHRVLRLRRGGTTAGDDIAWDPEAGTIDAGALEGVGAVVNLAGEGIGERRWTDEQKRRIRESRVRGTATLAAAIAGCATPPAVFVSGSAIGYYGDRGDEVLTEDSTPGDDFLAEVCTAWEAETRPAAEAGARVVHLRTGIVLGPHGGVLARLLLPFRLGIGGTQGSGRQWMSWITLPDTVAAIQRAISDPALDGAVNLTAPTPVRNSELTKTLGKVLRRPTVLPTPMFPLKLRFGAELVEKLLLVSQRVEPRRLLAADFEFAHPTLEQGLTALLRK
ncbi:MAG: TIGR01777 family oxidoreductase [Actinomycetota bacterium]